MTRPIRALVAAASLLILTGCASPVATEGTDTPTPSVSPTATPSPAPAVSPAQERSVTLSLDGLTAARGAGAEAATLENPEAVLVLIEQLTGQPRAGTDMEDPWGQGDVAGTLYEWDEITVSVMGERASVVVRAPSVGGVPFRTAQGIGVGSTREEAVAAGAWDGWDEDGDGVADYLGIGEREVPGTQSLTRPDQVGIEYVMLRVAGDVVEQIHVPANDFSDI